MGIESYHSLPGLQPECRTLPGLQWESGSPPDSGGNTRGRVKYRKELLISWKNGVITLPSILEAHPYTYLGGLQVFLNLM